MKPNPKALSVGLLYDDTLDSTDGVAQYVKTLGSWLSLQGHTVSYLVGETKTRQWSGGKIYSLARNFKVRFNANRLSIPMPAERRRISETLAGCRPDILHAQVPYSPFMAGRVIKAAGTNTAVVGTFHVYPSSRLVSFGTRLLRIILKNNLKKFDRRLSVSRPAGDFALANFGWKSEVVPNPVDLKQFKGGALAKDGTQAGIVFLGRLVRRKGCLELLRAFELLVRELPEAQLTIAGDGPQLAELERFVRRHKLGSNVAFAGFVTEKEKAKLLAKAKIACFPSLYGESFGIVLIEAMAAGAGVVVGGKNPGYESVLGENSEALIEPTDHLAVARKLKRLLTDEAWAANIHGLQQRQVRQFSVEVIGPQLVDIYRQAIASRGEKMHN